MKLLNRTGLALIWGSSLPFLCVLALWWGVCAAGWYPPSLLVSPSEVGSTLVELVLSRELQMHLIVSLQRLGLGLALGGVTGLVFGVLMGVSARFRDATGLLFHSVRQVPSIALIPILILMLGVGETFKVVIILKAAFFPVALAAADAVSGISASYVDVARAYRLPRRVVFWKVILPATMPDLITGFRLAAGRAWGTLVAAELIASEAGLGQMMELGRQMFRMDVVMLGLVITGLVGFALDRVLKRLESHLTGWRTAT
jgi:sulfonate transport system permease protein